MIGDDITRELWQTGEQIEYCRFRIPDCLRLSPRSFPSM